MLNYFFMCFGVRPMTMLNFYVMNTNDGGYIDYFLKATLIFNESIHRQNILASLCDSTILNTHLKDFHVNFGRQYVIFFSDK